MTFGEWDKDIAAMTDADLERYRAAMQTLREWPALYAEFKWTGLWVLTNSVQYEQEKRARLTARGAR